MFKVTHWVLITRSHLFSDLLNTRWPQEFLVKLHRVAPDHFNGDFLESRITIILIDLASVDVQTAYQIQRKVEKGSNVARVVFLHFPQQVDVSFLLQASVTAGVFYSDASLEQIGEGMVEIVKGKVIIPQDLIESNTAKDAVTDDAETLTIREREVLQVLRSGSTNIDIANQLFVSESTIKTHLYRAFRKIGVSSRGQAIAWAQTNLHEVTQ
ncbi:LuxR C-terminal-related transcriptional regulator [Shewanella fidelis]|uniref:LuxR C-terminal-related transcriptional regulator n=1 Tax=Shewanella fidelis TaxID=173509 RepID=A0AAW8NNV2_9GAMM|nr:LuxR C-terminal-related transcriptional regulator [Shewanella fidelis]MDR8523569.1 LuxR C-terminal-related transcriptional regulator [Shewanella fidelis]MDW4810116.1 LuxR C-terminal-related transcriptional regulator [Shewanella fidelis]MDW4814261.1 LuxR C-terminal-related transcriptional regulator [Shewanella fidelis]MDW4818352.1 LuxR C-terminal-related transcriptional regulator [Shewanella fidelis]MDW4823996.1 LuxR C-terminal-related transcriptional regulator [Shewanella fidelis]